MNFRWTVIIATLAILTLGAALEARSATIEEFVARERLRDLLIAQQAPKPRPRPVANACATAEMFEAEARKNLNEMVVTHYTAKQVQRFKRVLLEEFGSVPPSIMAADGLVAVHADGMVVQMFMVKGCGVFVASVPATKFDPLINKISIKVI